MLSSPFILFHYMSFCKSHLIRFSMEERTGEISVHRDVLKVELRGLNEEKHRYERTCY